MEDETSYSGRLVVFFKILLFYVFTLPAWAQNTTNESFQKAKEIFDQTSGDRLIIGSDCMVYKNKTLLGKPKDDNDAFKMLSSLSGSWHKVVTGLCVMVSKNGEERVYKTCDVTNVKFKKLSKESILSYIATGEPKDKAGAYAIQGKAGMFVEKVKRNLSTVIGIPTHKLYDILKEEQILK